MNRIDNFSMNQMGLGPGQGQVAAQTGSWRGEALTPKDEVSALADAAEEISMHHSEKAEAKHFAERKVQAEGVATVLPAQQVMEYLQATQAYEDAEKLALLAQRMQHSSNPGHLARQESRDPTRQYMLLQHALSDGLSQGLSPEQLEPLHEALAQLEMDSGPQIRAGINTLEAAREFAHSGAQFEQFQGAYQDLVLGHATLAQTLKGALERLGPAGGEDLSRALKGLIVALGADLSAARPSTDSTRLQSLVQDMYQLEVAATVLEGCHSLAGSLKERHGQSIDAPQVMKELVDISAEKWVASNRMSALADRQGLTSVGARIEFLTTTKTLLRELPTKIFPDPDTRQATLSAAQQALDNAIALEEE